MMNFGTLLCPIFGVQKMYEHIRHAVGKRRRLNQELQEAATAMEQRFDARLEELCRDYARQYRKWVASEDPLESAIGEDLMKMIEGSHGDELREYLLPLKTLVCKEPTLPCYRPIPQHLWRTAVGVLFARPK